MSHSSVKQNNISYLNKQHRDIYELFIVHQKLLMHGDIDSAYDNFLKLKKFLKSHMDTENDLLLPLYKKYVSPIPIGGAVEFFIHEHHKINRFLAEFSGKFVQLKRSGNPQEIDLVKLFDQHYKFKHLLDHHHSREDTFLFRLLDRVLEEKKRNEVLKHFEFTI
jgi:hemerythrin-like domain-containing protein